MNLEIFYQIRFIYIQAYHKVYKNIFILEIYVIYYHKLRQTNFDDRKFNIIVLSLHYD